MANNAKTCFIILPGFAPDPVPTLPLKQHLEKMGYPVIGSNFWGDAPLKDFSALTIEQCMEGVRALIDKARNEYDRIIGIGISLGGALLIEHAKNHSDLDYIVSIGTPFKLRHRKLISLGFGALPLLYPFWRLLEKTKIFRLPPIGCSKMLVKFLEGGFLNDLDSVKTPVLFLQSKKDFITDYSALPKFTGKLLNKKVIIFENGSHVINYDTDNIAASTFDFLESNPI